MHLGGMMPLSRPAQLYVPNAFNVRSFAGLGDILGSAVGTAAGLTSGLATAGIGAAVSLATSGIQMWMNSIQLSHEADTATTQIVNGLEPLLRANVAAFQSSPQTQCNQQVALYAFDAAWQWLTSAAGCGNGAYGSAGNRCISDRNRGGKWDWFSYYRDPIANANVPPNTACPGTTSSGSGQSTDVVNDSGALLPGTGQNDPYAGLLANSGQAYSGVTNTNTGTGTSGSNPLSSIAGTFGISSTELQSMAVPIGLLLLVLLIA